jgi:hypothetical protein
MYIIFACSLRSSRPDGLVPRGKFSKVSALEYICYRTPPYGVLLRIVSSSHAIARLNIHGPVQPTCSRRYHCHICTYVYIHTYIRMYIHTCIHPYVYTYVCVTRGGPWVPSLTKQNLNRTQNHEVFAA